MGYLDTRERAAVLNPLLLHFTHDIEIASWRTAK